MAKALENRQKVKAVQKQRNEELKKEQEEKKKMDKKQQECMINNLESSSTRNAKMMQYYDVKKQEVEMGMSQQIDIGRGKLLRVVSENIVVADKQIIDDDIPVTMDKLKELIWTVDANDPLFAEFKKLLDILGKDPKRFEVMFGLKQVFKKYNPNQ
eukprot:282920_1